MLGFVFGLVAMYLATGLFFHIIDRRMSANDGFTLTTREKWQALWWPKVIWASSKDPFWN